MNLRYFTYRALLSRRVTFLIMVVEQRLVLIVLGTPHTLVEGLLVSQHVLVLEKEKNYFFIFYAFIT